MTVMRVMAGLGCFGLLAVSGCFDEPDRELPMDGSMADAGGDASMDAGGSSMQSSVQIEGSVVASGKLAPLVGDSADGSGSASLVGARVHALSQDGDELGVATTDGNGGFSLMLPSGDPVLLRADGDGFVAALSAVPREDDFAVSDPIELLPFEDVSAAVRAGTGAAGDERRYASTRGTVVVQLEIDDPTAGGAGASLDAEHGPAFHIVGTRFVGGNETLPRSGSNPDAGTGDAGDAGTTMDPDDTTTAIEVNIVFPNAEPGPATIELTDGCNLDEEHSPLATLPIQPNTITRYQGSCD